MKVQFNTDKTISGDQRSTEYFTDFISEGLRHHSDHITRVEAHLSGENGNKEGANDIKCLLEARVEGKKPIAVSSKADTVEMAVSHALDKLNASLESVLGRLKSH